MNTKIFNKEINIIDNPSIPRGLGSKPFDDEGCEMKKLKIVENGTLKSWFLDNTTAQQLGIKSNNRASRGMSSPPSPSPTNMFIENGSHSKDRIINNIKDGFYVTDLIGQGVNLITGDYSRGAGGFKIENGEISFPINEVTIAGNLKDMFNRMIVANDLEFKYSLNSPTILIEGMIIAGV
jgi:PmbA protein